MFTLNENKSLHLNYLKTTTNMKILILAFSLLTSYSFAQALPTWSVDVSHSNMGFKVKHKTISYTVGDFRDFELIVKTPNESFENAQVNLTIKTASINTANDSRDEHLRGVDFFDALQFPEIIFVSKKVTATKSDEYAVLGDLSMHGITKELTLLMKHNGTAKTRRGSELAGLYFSTIFKRLDFNIGTDMPTSVVADDIELNAEIEIIKD